MPTTPTATVTATVARITALLVLLGMAPRTGVRPYRGTLELRFFGYGPDSPFGVVRIGARKGRVLRGFVQHGNSGRKRTFTGCADALAAVREIAPTAGAVVRYHGSRSDFHGRFVVVGVREAGYYAGRVEIATLDGALDEYGRPLELVISAGNRSITVTGEHAALTSDSGGAR